MLVGFVLTLMLLADCLAYHLIYKDKLSDNKQKIFQSMLVFFLPILGALIVILVNKAEPSSDGKFPEKTELDAGDGSLRTGNKNETEFDGNDD
jgi:hypothetical protein